MIATLRPLFACVSWACALTILFACIPEPENAPITERRRLAQAGESCVLADDCDGELKCSHNVCAAPCQISQQCPIAGDVCISGTCVTAPNTCTPTCLPSEECTNNACVPIQGYCTAAATCAVNETCNTTINRCEAIPGFCNATITCPNGQDCNNATNLCEPILNFCDGPNQCATGQQCNTGLQRCEAIPGYCDGTIQCPNGQQCNTAILRCEPIPNFCDGNNPCPNGQLCNSTTQLCEIDPNYCDINTPCTTIGQICDNATNQCVTDPNYCNNTITCPLGRICNNATNQCVTDPNYCDNTTLCQTGEQCNASNQCEPIPGYCNSTIPCGNGEVCNQATNRCEPAPTGCAAVSMQIGGVEGANTLFGQFTVVGSGFGGLSLALTVGGQPAPISDQTDTRLEAILPPLAPGYQTYSIELTNPTSGCVLTETVDFRIFRPYTPLSIPSILSEPDGWTLRATARQADGIPNDIAFLEWKGTSAQVGIIQAWGQVLTSSSQYGYNEGCNLGDPIMTPIGDLDGDAINEILVGSPHTNDPSEQGQVCLYSGANGTHLGNFFGVPPKTVGEAGWAPLRFGCGAVSTGDIVNAGGLPGADGVGDFAVTSCGNSQIHIYSGAAVMSALSSGAGLKVIGATIGIPFGFGGGIARERAEMQMMHDIDFDGVPEFAFLNSSASYNVNSIEVLPSSYIHLGGVALPSAHGAASTTNFMAFTTLPDILGTDEPDGLTFMGSNGRIYVASTKATNTEPALLTNANLDGISSITHGSLAPIDDVTGDGISDLVAIAQGTADGLPASIGIPVGPALYSGAALTSGAPMSPLRVEVLTASEQANGFSIISMGDLNGDTFPEVAYTMINNQISQIVIRSLYFE